VGNRLERLAHWRSRLSPAQRRTFQELLAHRYKREMGERLLCLDFSSTHIDDDGGRALYRLVRDFVALGYLPIFRAHFGFLATMRHERFKRLLLESPFAVFDDRSDLPADVVYVTDDPTASPTEAAKLIRVRYEPCPAGDSAGFVPPLAVHPEVDAAGGVSDRIPIDRPRPMRIYHDGRLPPASAATSSLPMTCQRVLAVVNDTLTERQKQRLSGLNEPLSDGGEPCLFTCADANEEAIPAGRRMARYLASDFALVCAEEGGPVPHALIEALAAGAVPILQFGDALLSPPLEDGLNCLGFDSPEELITTVHWAMTMPAKEIRRLRAEARVYYDAHLRPGRFAERLLATPRQSVNLYVGEDVLRLTGSA